MGKNDRKDAGNILSVSPITFEEKLNGCVFISASISIVIVFLKNFNIKICK